MNAKLHIVAFDLPYPPDYGGAIDVYYKLKALHRKGVQIILHAFVYGKKQHLVPESSPLAEFCYQIYAYPRLPFWQSSPLRYPYIVGSRRHPDLWRNLCADRYPILFEGLHTCAYLPQVARTNRYCMVRMHNIEADYYAYLYRSEKNIIKKMYYGIEAHSLKRYESVLNYADAIAAISPADTALLQQRYGKTSYLPAFHAHDRVMSLPGKGNFALYHGNLGVSENEAAALFLLRNVFVDTTHLSLPLIIAGKNPSPILISAISRQGNVRLVSDPDAATMQKLVTDAHVHLLPTFQPTGIKLKLLESLFSGRFCIANDAMTAQTGVASLCHIANSPSEFITVLNQLAVQPFTEAMLSQRKQLLEQSFSNEYSAEQLIQSINFAGHNP